MCELTLWSSSASVETVDSVLVVGSHENRLAKVLDSTRRAWNNSERRLDQDAISRVVEDDTARKGIWLYQEN